MYGLLPLFVIMFFIGVVFQEQGQVASAMSQQTVSASAGVGESQVLAYGDACMFLGQETPGLIGQFTLAQVSAASPYPMQPGTTFGANWDCVAQAGASAGTRDLVAVFPGVKIGSVGNVVDDTQSDYSWWQISGLTGNGNYRITQATNLGTGAVVPINPAIAVTAAAGTLGTGNLFRWEIVGN